MLRKRTFQLKHLCNSSSFDSFAEIYKYITENKKKIEETFQVACFDHNFNEPMNSIRLECDPRNHQVDYIEAYANKINDLFDDNPNKIVISFDVHEIPTRDRKMVYFWHEWFIKEPLVQEIK